MQILDKVQSKSPWEQMTEQERATVLQGAGPTEWMFKQTTTLTLLDPKTGQVSQLGELPLESVRYSQWAVLKKRVRRWVARRRGG